MKSKLLCAKKASTEFSLHICVIWYTFSTKTAFWHELKKIGCNLAFSRLISSFLQHYAKFFTRNTCGGSIFVLFEVLKELSSVLVPNVASALNVSAGAPARSSNYENHTCPVAS